MNSTCDSSSETAKNLTGIKNIPIILQIFFGGKGVVNLHQVVLIIPKCSRSIYIYIYAHLLGYITAA